MSATPPTFLTLQNPTPDEMRTDHVEFLKSLGGPTFITVDGADTSRSRAIVTLLHGNEPSGLKAVHEFLRSGETPAVNLGVFVASVNAAALEPVFSHRYLPEEEDLNRCFIPPYDTDQRRLAKEILTTLKAFHPEAVVDTHNTSGHSEPFAVATSDDEKTLQLTQNFSSRLVVLDLTLGTLIEQREMLDSPIVTIEFGGFMDKNADQLAKVSLREFVTAKSLFRKPVEPMMVLRHPHRLEVEKASVLHYSSSMQPEADVTVFNTIDQLNFSSLPSGTQIGWINEMSFQHLHVISADGEDLITDYLIEKDGSLITTQAITLFMATTDPFIAKKDCLLYLTAARL